MKKTRFIANITLILSSMLIVFLIRNDINYKFFVFICILSTVVSFIITAIFIVRFIIIKIQNRKIGSVVF